MKKPPMQQEAFKIIFRNTVAECHGYKRYYKALKSAATVALLLNM
jgi:hypothetical protein